MSTATLLLDATVASLTAALFAYAGVLTQRRAATGRGPQRALYAFTTWWYGLAAYTGLAAAREVLVIGGNRNLLTHIILNDLTTIPLVALLWGLVSYLAYIYTGKMRVFGFVTALHVAILAFYVYVIVTLIPSGVKVNNWSVGLDYAAPIPPWMIAAILLTILLPALFAAVLYFSLYFRTEDPTARYRIGLVGGSFVGWFGAAAIASASPLGTWYYWPLVARLIGLAATGMILLAYLPPKSIQARYGIRPSDA